MSTAASRRSAAAIAFVLLVGCADRPETAVGDAPASVDPGTTVVDAAGRTHEFAEPARRIVSLVPSATATLLELGLGDRIIGRTDFDDDPRLSDVPSVGGGLEPNLEVLASLQPDLVIRFEGEQDPTTPARLDDLGIRHLGIRPVGLEDVFDTNALIGAATHQRADADALSATIRAGLDGVRADASDRPPVRAVFTLGGTPPWVAGPETYVSEIIALAGGVNVFDDLPVPWSSLSREEFRVREIDVVLTPNAASVRDDLVPGARVVSVGDALDQPGPDIVAAARIVYEALHDPDAS